MQYQGRRRYSIKVKGDAVSRSKAQWNEEGEKQRSYFLTWRGGIKSCLAFISLKLSKDSDYETDDFQDIQK